jgi:hypothetical protein
MRRSAQLAVVAGVVVVLVGALAWWRPFLTEDRSFPASIPQPPPLFNLPLIALKPGESTCMQPVVVDTHSERAGFVVETNGRPGQPLRVTLTGPGYRSEGTAPGGYPDHGTALAPVRPPARDVAVRACVENAGRRTISLWGSNDRTRTPLTATGAATKVNANPVLTFFEAKPSSLAGHLPIAFRRMAEFRPGFVGPWLIWPLAAICVVGLVAGSLWALWRSIRDDADEDEIAPPPDAVAEPTREPTWDRASAT